MAEKPAKKKQEKTAAQIAGENARKAATAAREKYKAAGNEANKIAYEKAKKFADEATAKENKERFIRVGNGRYIKAVAAIQQLEAVANPKTYSYTGAELDKLAAGISQAYNNLAAVFNRAKTGEKAAKTDVALPLG